MITQLATSQSMLFLEDQSQFTIATASSLQRWGASCNNCGKSLAGSKADAFYWVLGHNCNAP